MASVENVAQEVASEVKKKKSGKGRPKGVKRELYVGENGERFKGAITFDTSKYILPPSTAWIDGEADLGYWQSRLWYQENQLERRLKPWQDKLARARKKYQGEIEELKAKIERISALPEEERKAQLLSAKVEAQLSSAVSKLIDAPTIDQSAIDRQVAELEAAVQRLRQKQMEKAVSE